MLIEVAVAAPMDRTFTYAAAGALRDQCETGKRVMVPFGRQRLTGYVLGPESTPPEVPAKRILDVLDDAPLFPAEMVPFFRWIANYYLYPIGLVIRNALPAGLNLREYSALTLTEAGRDALMTAILTPTERAVLETLAERALRVPELNTAVRQTVPEALLRMMTDRAWLVRERKLVHGTTGEKTMRYVRLGPRRAEPEDLSSSRRTIIEEVTRSGEISLQELKKHVPTAAQLVPKMAGDGLLERFEKPVYRNPFGEPIAPDAPKTLTGEQTAVVSAVLKASENGFAPFLLAGVTGSGKTEVYMHLTDAVVKRGRPVIVLVPEIALISQMEQRFRARFGERIAVLHSSLSPGERFDQWRRITAGDAPVVIGARSAIFAPLSAPGLIIVDEEHDSSYKQGSDLLYNARDLATVRAKQAGAAVLLGSATPSVQSLHNVRSRKLTEVRLTRRVERRPMPTVRVVDLRETRDMRGARRFITPALHTAIERTLADGDQVLLFLNRRGFAGFPVCHQCGEALRCRHCDITLTFHKLANLYRCHYCGYTLPASLQCPACQAHAIRLLGLGTEKVEEAVKALFPHAAVARMDRDTTSRKGSILKILKALRNRAIDLLVGTQMVAKGHDFPNITLVGIICADLSLNFPDFRAGEQTFQLLAQVSGRAGRGEKPGEVILQTYTPDHFSIMAARRQDIQAFYRTEIGFRQALNYPPFTRMIQLRLSGKDPDKARDAALALGDLCREVRGRDEAAFRTVEILGPIEAPIARIADRYRWQMLLKCAGVSVIHDFVRAVRAEGPELFQNRSVRVVVDVDPVFMA